jgi:hypothetical protein
MHAAGQRSALSTGNLFAEWSELQRPEINAVGNQQVEGDVGRTAARAPGIVEHDQFAIEHIALGRRSSTSSKRRIRLPLREINRPRTVSAAARNPSNFASNTQSGWSRRGKSPGVV